MASTAAVFYVNTRAVSGVFKQGIGSSTSRPQNIDWLPSVQVPLGYVNMNGQKLPVYIEAATWYAFMQEIARRFGGRLGLSIPDLAVTVEQTQVTAVQAGQQLAAATQQSQANAEALAVSVQVIQSSALPGATQIPRVVLSPTQYIP